MECIDSWFRMNHKDTKAQRETEEISMEVNELARQVVDAAFHVHKNLGAGLLESAYDIYEINQHPAWAAD